MNVFSSNDSDHLPVFLSRCIDCTKYIINRSNSMQNNEYKIDINKNNYEAFKQELFDQIDCGLLDVIDLQIDDSGSDVDVIVACFERALLTCSDPFKRLNT